MSGSKRSTKRLEMNWLEIDKILWNTVQVWDGSESGKQDILKIVSKKFGWTEKQSSDACNMHFNLYTKKKTGQNSLMNIFRLDNDPVIAAQLQCDKHVVKMIVESAQMLSTAHRMLDGYVEKRQSKSGKRMVNYWVHPDKSMEDALYKAVHHGHPSTVWTMESKANYDWHYTHFVALLDEYTYRYGKEHGTAKLKDTLAQAPRNIPLTSETPFKLAMADYPECIALGDPVKAYRAFYQTKQDRFKMVWTKRDIPEWFKVAA